MNTAKSNTFIPRTNPHAVCGRPTLKDVERSVWNGSVRELCQRSIYERTTMSELIENHCISIELSTDCKFSDGLFVDCKCPETEVARNRNDYQLKRLVGSEEDTILTTDAIFISSQNGFEDQTKKTTTTSVIINWVSLVILFFAIVAFVLLLTGTILFFNSLIMSLTALTLIACLVKHFISLDALVFLFAGTILYFNCFILIIAITILAYLFKSFISCPKTNACTETVDISVFDNCDLLEKANHLTVKFRNDSMVTINTTRDIRSRYSKHVYHSFSDVRVLTQRCVSKRDREPSRIPVRTLKCLAKKSRKLPGESLGSLSTAVSALIIYMKKLLNSDWLRKEYSSSVTRVQTCNTSANYKCFLIGRKHKRNQQEPIRLELF